MRLIDADAMEKRRIDYIVDGYAESVNDMTEWGMALIEAPTVGGWIPCSDRLPEVNGRYLCANDEWGAWRVDINMWVNGHWRNQIEKPIAWMRLPEPYSIESDGIEEENDE